MYTSHLHACRHPYLGIVKEDRHDKGIEQAGAQMGFILQENFLGKCMKGASGLLDLFPCFQGW